MLLNFTLVQHSGYGFGGNRAFEHALECFPVQPEEEEQLVALGALVLPYGQAQDYADDAFLRASGHFLYLEVGGLRVFRPTT